MSDDYVDIDCVIRRTTLAAVLIAIPDDDEEPEFWEEHWIPKSQIADDERYFGDGEVTLSIAEWIAEDRGLI
jgi:hypothetical protein